VKQSPGRDICYHKNYRLGGVTVMTAEERIKKWKALLVTHGGVITVITCLIYGFKYSNLLKLNIPLASVTKFK